MDLFTNALYAVVHRQTGGGTAHGLQAGGVVQQLAHGLGKALGLVLGQQDRRPLLFKQAGVTPEMLMELSDHTHEVVTGVTILYQGKAETFSSVAEVKFYPLSEKEIDEYIATNEPMDKAGAYAIQGDAAKFIQSIHGDYYTIVGLPVAELYHRLKKYL